MGRQQQAELGHERQERASVLSQAEAAARSVGQFESRLRLLEDSQHRVEDAVAALRLAHETLTHDMEELSSRGARNLEAALRLEHQIDSQAAEAEALQKRDGELEDRMSLYEEKIRQQEERVNKFEGHLSLPLEIKEQLDRSRFERQKISERLVKLETSANDLLERTAEFVQGLARLDQRTQVQASSHLETAEILRRHRETVGDQLQRLVRVMERQRRRQAEALAQEIKELARSDFNPEK
jgi:chromosome segregation ATPase